MKKLFLIPLMLLATLTIATACSGEGPIPDGQEQTTPEEDDGKEDDEGNNGRYLVLYCSRTGNTERMAQTIQSTLDCDMIEVVPETPYEDDYNAMLDRAQAELDAIGQGNYPAITTSVESFDAYDIVFIGYPIWYGHIATPMPCLRNPCCSLQVRWAVWLHASRNGWRAIRSSKSGISTGTAPACCKGRRVST